MRLIDWIGSEIGNNPTLLPFRSSIESIHMREVVAIFDRQDASENLQGIFRKIVMFAGILEGGMPGMFRLFFGDEMLKKGKKDIDVIESNMR